MLIELIELKFQADWLSKKASSLMSSYPAYKKNVKLLIPMMEEQSGRLVQALANLKDAVEAEEDLRGDKPCVNRLERCNPVSLTG